jgi:hypothetical protein
MFMNDDNRKSVSLMLHSHHANIFSEEHTFGESPPVAMCYYATIRRDDLQY